MNKILTLAFKPVDYLLGWPDKGEGSEYLQGNYAPVEEEITTHECEVVGKLPEAVAGSFCRNGPNPKFAPTGGYHWFDGDGMIHAVRIKPSGSATYTNRYVRTKKLEAEEEAGRPVAFKMGDLGTRLGFPKMLVSTLKSKLGIHPDFRSMGESVANTSLEFHAGRLLALCEGGLPYHLRVLCEGVIETIGSMSFDGQMKMPFTAHPKKDPSTGKLYSFGYRMDAEPFVTMYVLDAEGKLERQFPVDVGRGVMMHDFAITEKHAIFLDLPLVFKKEKVLTGGFPLEFDKTLGARMGVLSLDAPDSSSIRWFDMPEAFFAFHVLNAWEEKVQVEGSTNTVIKVITCDSFEINLNPEDLTDIADPARLSRPHVTTLNLDTGKATRALVVPPATIEGLDFPQLRRTLVGRKNRFGYFTGFDTKGGMAALVKVDLEASPETAEVARIDLGDWYGGEGLFIPNSGEGVEEDDGFLVTFVSPKDCGKSELRVWDAKTMSPDPVATVKLPARVPLGFHALFVSEEEMATQDQQQQQ